MAGKMITWIKWPWFLKMFLKILLARFPVPHAIWYKVGIFKHGEMADFSYARGVFVSHLAKAGLEEIGKNLNKTILEVGPGESLTSALFAKAYGFKRSVLLDVGNFTLPDLTVYQELARKLAGEGMPCPLIHACGSIEEMLIALDSQYLITGLKSLKMIPDESVDFIFSNAVLEHIRKKEFSETSQEFWRILKPGGICTHVVDYRDHLEESLHNLRFSDWFWEADWIASSGFYTNRIRFGEMIRIFEALSFEVQVLNKVEWQTLPISKKYLNVQFRSMPDAELKISLATLRLVKSQA